MKNELQQWPAMGCAPMFGQGHETPDGGFLFDLHYAYPLPIGELST